VDCFDDTHGLVSRTVSLRVFLSLSLSHARCLSITLFRFNLSLRVDHCDELQCVAVRHLFHCSTLQHTTTHCVNTLGRDMDNHDRLGYYSTATHCNTWKRTQLTATHCNMLHNTGLNTQVSMSTNATSWALIPLQRNATRYNTLQHTGLNPQASVSIMMTRALIPLQHTATHCNTLQHTATHRSQHTGFNVDNRDQLGARDCLE